MSYMDILMERLRQYDEVQILELLDISTEDLLDRFKDKVHNRYDYLEREMELLQEDEEDLVDELDGFQIEYVDPLEEDDDDF